MSDIFENGNSLGWHALNYRAAHTVHAQAMWLELERHVDACVAEAYRAGIETAAVIADRSAAGLARQSTVGFSHVARSIAAAIRAQLATTRPSRP